MISDNKLGTNSNISIAAKKQIDFITGTYPFTHKNLTNERVLDRCGNYSQQNISWDDVSESPSITIVQKQVV